MKASTFIKTALITQMQQIADLGLWFHLAKLIPSGVEVLARVRLPIDTSKGYGTGDRYILPSAVPGFIVDDFYAEYAPEYSGKYSISKEFFSLNQKTWLVSDQQGAEYHLKNAPTGESVIYVPQWWEDFKGWCDVILSKIESGDLEDIEVLKMGEA